MEELAEAQFTPLRAKCKLNKRVVSMAVCRSTPCAADMPHLLSKVPYLPRVKAGGAFVLLEQNM